MTKRTLGRLNRVDLRNIWPTEAGDFTPWLAQEENLSVLGETLGIDLELEAQEKDVGPFRADILCKDTSNDSWVLVENQLERTDHKHLGQLLTYASGLEAVSIVWIAGKFTDEHRSTLDWMNRITETSFRFFALEVELWRIDDSLAAPKFNVVSKPNDWSRSVAKSARALDESELTETRLLQRDYWEALLSDLARGDGPVSGRIRTAQPSSWMGFPIGRRNFRIHAGMNIRGHEIRVALYLSGSRAKKHFALLCEDKEAVEQEIGYPLVWEEMPNGTDSRVSVRREGVNPKNESDWPGQHAWFVEKLNDIHRIFAQRIQSLDAG